MRPKIWKKPIEQVKVGDYVVSHDKNGNMVPGYVPRVMENRAKNLLDFWGTGVTPGHAYFCADGRFKGEHVPVLDILRSDGAFVNLDGQVVRAATNFEVGSREDGFVSVVTGLTRADGTVNVKQSRRIRLGTRFKDTDGETRTVLDVIQRENWLLHDDGLVSRTHVDEKRPFHLHFMDRIPKPEDYILERSNLTLAQIYAAGEWEQIKPKMPAPATATAIAPPAAASSTTAVPSLEPKANIPPAFANHPDAPKKAAQPKPQRMMNRKQRKAIEAKQRKTTKIRRNSA